MRQAPAPTYDLPIVEVEIDIGPGLPAINIVGLLGLSPSIPSMPERFRPNTYRCIRDDGNPEYPVWQLVPYDEMVDPAEAEAAALKLDEVLPGVPATLGVGHPAACEALSVLASSVRAQALHGVTDWPECHFTIGTEDDRIFFVLPQADGRAGQRGHCGSEAGRALRDPPDERHLDGAADCRGAGADRDAAGYPDPHLGQGLSVALRDVRVVSELLLATEHWSPCALAYNHAA